MGGVVVAAHVAAVMWAWSWANDRPECSGSFRCLADALAVGVLGVPFAALTAWLALRALGARLPGLVLLAASVAAWLGANALEPLDPPLWVWPGVAGAVAVVVMSVVGRLTSRIRM